MKLKFKTPAKVNLGLHIHRKRKDGFHELETIFQMVSLYDEIELESHRRINSFSAWDAGMEEGEPPRAYLEAERDLAAGKLDKKTFRFFYNSDNCNSYFFVLIVAAFVLKGHCRSDRAEARRLLWTKMGR